VLSLVVAATNRQVALPRPGPISGHVRIAVRKILVAGDCRGQTAAKRPDFRPDRKCFHRAGAVRVRQYGRLHGTGSETGSRSVCERGSARL
jgi:hypothetical protein